MRLLLAEDEPVTRRMMSALLTRWGYEVIAVTNGDEAIAVLSQADPPRIALLDWEMPGMEGVAVCQAVRQRGAEPYVYLMLVTQRDGREDVLAGLDAGADDYVTKPFDHGELAARLRSGRRIVTLQEELVRTRECMRRAAVHDGLTGLLNRAGIFDVLRQLVGEAARTRAPLTVVVGDVDHFKQINDEHGHAAGDAVLQEVAARLNAGVRGRDCVGRIGGEEFLLVLPECDTHDACLVVQRLQGARSTNPGGPRPARGVNPSDAPTLTLRRRPAASPASACRPRA